MSDEQEKEEVAEAAVSTEQETAASEAAGGEDEKTRYYNNWMRAEAELQNLKKQTRKEKEDYRKFALESFVLEILKPVDYLEMAIDHAKSTSNVEALIQGVEYTHKCLLDILRDFGVEQIDSEGKCFDPAIHEAHDVVEDDGVSENTVLKQYRKAYKLAGRLLRAGIVSVSKKPSGAAVQESESEEKPCEIEKHENKDIEDKEE